MANAPEGNWRMSLPFFPSHLFPLCSCFLTNRRVINLYNVLSTKVEEKSLVKMNHKGFKDGSDFGMGCDLICGIIIHSGLAFRASCWQVPWEAWLVLSHSVLQQPWEMGSIVFSYSWGNWGSEVKPPAQGHIISKWQVTVWPQSPLGGWPTY